jgi:hypothetical protein
MLRKFSPLGIQGELSLYQSQIYMRIHRSDWNPEGIEIAPNSGSGLPVISVSTIESLTQSHCHKIDV